MFPRATADLLRGCAVGATAGVLAVAGHGLGGGGTPSAAAATALALICGISGLVARRFRSNRITTPGLLVTTQLAGHFLLSAVTDAPHVHHTPAPMLAAHTAAAALCGLLIVIGDRLVAGLDAAISALTHVPGPQPSRVAAVHYFSDAPGLSAWSLAPISRRGPPVVCAL